MTQWLNKTVLGFLAGVAVCALGWWFLSASNSKKVVEERPVVSSFSFSPEIPSEIVFCGERISLEPFQVHENFDRELSSFTYLHSTTMLLLKRANRFFPIVEPILRENGIPDDFKYLAVIESNLDVRATSSARAVGLWQFLESTGKQYGLTVTPTVDERRHVEKSTVAACKYLKDAYKKYNDWSLVAASYNGGMGRITDELNKQQADSYFDLWLVEETTRYVYRIMAIKQIFENPYKYGFVLKPENLYKPMQYKEVSVSQDIADLADFAKKQGVSYGDLKRYNVWLRDRKLVTGGKTYKIKIPNANAVSYHHPNTYVHNPRWVTQ